MEHEDIGQGVEVIGKLVYSSVAGFPMVRCLPAKILVKKGIGKSVNKKFQIGNNDWYSRQVWLDALKEMSSRFGDDALMKIGMTIPEIVPLPEWVTDLDSAVKYGEKIHHTYYRKNGNIMYDVNSDVLLEGISHYSYSRNGNEYTIMSESSFPCTLVKGLLTAIAKKFEQNSIVIHDDSTSCCKRGDKLCTYKIRW